MKTMELSRAGITGKNWASSNTGPERERERECVSKLERGDRVKAVPHGVVQRW